MYRICLSSSWNVAREFHSKGITFFIGRWRTKWIVDACMLKVTMHVGARSMIDESFELESIMNISFVIFIIWDFALPTMPCIIILRGGEYPS